jgi:hypothetical protein
MLYIYIILWYLYYIIFIIYYTFIIYLLLPRMRGGKWRYRRTQEWSTISVLERKFSDVDVVMSFYARLMGRRGGGEGCFKMMLVISYLSQFARFCDLGVAAVQNITRVVWTFSPNGTTAPSGAGHPDCRGFTITLRHTTLGRTPLDGWSARRRNLYLTTHNTHNRQTSMPPVGFEPAIPASKRLKPMS